MTDLLQNIADTLQRVEIMVVLSAIFVIPYMIYMVFDAAVRAVADKFYTHLEEKKKQKEYDEMITRHEERYHNK